MKCHTIGTQNLTQSKIMPSGIQGFYSDVLVLVVANILCMNFGISNYGDSGMNGISEF